MINNLTCVSENNLLVSDLHKKPVVYQGMLDKILFFVEVSRLGSISSAADSYGISVATGSRWLYDLEKELELPLLKRKGPHITLTHDGIFLFNRTKMLNDAVYHINQDLLALKKEPSGLIKICCTPIYACDYLLPIMASFSEKYPKIHFQLDVNPFGLESCDRYDITFSALSSYDDHLERNIDKVRKPIMHEPFIVVASPGYLNRCNYPKSPLNLSQHKCLYARSLTVKKEWEFNIDGKITTVRLQDVLEVSDSFLLLKAACLGIGIAYLPRFVVQEKLHCGELVQLFTDIPTSEWMLNMYYSPSCELDAITLLFKEHFAQENIYKKHQQ
ncbi:HTH-type transcriptional regulator PgrR [invertebrate metagenome]|uniref:HTH-type transcriptional regulator PgrR n=1 Tax=invertebrate metagenome TaxID=1711999 RepID=A0A2H9T8Q7_9ZZZZ